MAVFAGLVEAATFHFDGDDVERGMVMKATGLGIEIQAADIGSGLRHLMNAGLIEQNSKMQQAQGRREGRGWRYHC